MAIIDVAARMSNQMRAAMDKEAELAAEAPATGGDLASLRERYLQIRRWWNEGGPEMAASLDIVAEQDGIQVPIRILRPRGCANTETLPGIAYIHGGSYYLGSAQTHDRVMRFLAELSGSVVIGIDYSLSPEARFPRAVRECAAAVSWVAHHGSEHSIDPSRLAIAGDSAGANLALATTLWLRDQGWDTSRLKALLLYYGIFGLRDSPSRRTLGGPWDELTPADLDAAMRNYFPEDNLQLDSPYFDCLSADLSWGVPPSCLVTAELDPLKDDSVALAEILKEVGVDCRLTEYSGVLHAFLHYSRMLDAAADALRNGAQFARRHLAEDE